jgi:hypothetical protein
VNHHNVEKIKLIDLNVDCFNYLKWIDFLSVQLLTDVLSVNIDNVKLNSVFSLKLWTYDFDCSNKFDWVELEWFSSWWDCRDWSFLMWNATIKTVKNTFFLLKLIISSECWS